MLRKKTTYLVLFLLAFVISSCAKINENKVRIIFINKTGSDLNALKVKNKFIGKLKNEERTHFVAFDKYLFDSGHPIEDFSAKMEGNHCENYPYMSFCATEYYEKTDGDFEMEIHKYEAQGKTYLRLIVSKVY